MKIDRARLMDLLKGAGKPLGLQELLGGLKLHPGQRTDLKRLMRELTREGAVLRAGKRFQIPGGPKRPERPAGPVEAIASGPALIGSHAGRRGKFLIGTLHRHPDGFGFVAPLTGGGKGKDLFLPADEVRRALDGDLVRVQVVSGQRGRPAGRLVDVIERRRRWAVGTYVSRGSMSYVLPSDPQLANSISVPPSPMAQDGDLVKVAVLRGPTATTGPQGEIAEVVGEVGDPRAEVLEIAYRRGFEDQFPTETVEDAERWPDELDPAELAKRRDLRGLKLVTIDGEDARDFDDAVYVERSPRGWRLVVAIADVAHYVRPGQPLDMEALRRGTSVYFPNHVLPMLPERLSNGLCSLKPNEDRLCLVADLIFETEGHAAKCVSAELYEGVMRSAARCTYNEVHAVLQGKRVPGRDGFREDFKRMEELSKKLTAAREQRGAIDFDLPETKVMLDAAGRPVRLERRARNIAHRIIEEFMLAANEAVARFFSTRGLPSVYRVHAEPDEEKLEIFLALARAHGFALQAGQEISGKALNGLLKKIAGSPEQRTLNFLMLRSMMQAIYSSENIGHFGLAAPFYLHFTSPIRRYPDLIVHRLLKEHRLRGSDVLSPQQGEALEERLDGIAARSSERERAAMEAERETSSYFAALLMKDRIGEELDGSVCAVTDFGFFVELKEEYVEGLVKMESVGEGGELDLERHRIVFPGGLVFDLGTEVRIRVKSVSVARRQIDFELVAVKGKRHVVPEKKRGKEAGKSRRPAEAPPRKSKRSFRPSKRRRR